MLNNQAAERLGPLFVNHGWAFFMPYRRGQGLSESAGPYIMDQVDTAEKKGGTKSATETLNRLLTTDHLDDQMAALAWLKKANFVKPNHIAVAGNSFGGIQTVLGAEKGSYCAGVDAAGAAQSWANAPEIQSVMTRAVRQSHAPIFFFQAENDFDLSPSKALSKAMKDAGKTSEMKIYPAFGKSPKDGHAFAYMGEAIWANDVFSFLKKHCEK